VAKGSEVNAQQLTDSERLAVVEVKIDAVHEDLHSIWQSLKDASGRPTWAVALAFTFLTSLSVGLSVVVATQAVS
jgi:hypothetical protein